MINSNAYGLKRPCGRVLIALPPGIGCGDHVGEIPRTSEGRVLAPGDYGAGHAAGETLLAVLKKHPRHFFFASRIDPVGGASTTCGVHAHVQWTVLHKTEPTVSLIELRRGHPQIQ